MNDKLTEEQIRSMEAGYKMDNLIAELIFERTFCTVHHGFHCCGRSDPKWSTNIAAAWEVVQKMKADGYSVNIADVTEQEWHVDFYPTTRDHFCWWAESWGDPWLAVCRAALLVMMEVSE